MCFLQFQIKQQINETIQYKSKSDEFCVPPPPAILAMSWENLSSEVCD